MPYLSAVQHEIVNIEKVRRKYSGILAITGRFCSRPLYMHYPMTQTFFDKFQSGKCWKYRNKGMETEIQKREENRCLVPY